MLRNLSIRDVVLIDRLDLGFQSGLSVLTGETGSGKSILLDALGLAIGVRADSDLVRETGSQSSVTAAFDLERGHAVWAILDEQGLDADGELVLRRIVNADGRSRAFVNDQPVGVALLRRIGETLIEVQGQFEAHGLLDPATHCGFVDGYGGLASEKSNVADAHAKWRDAVAARERAEADFETARRDEEFLRHAAAELARLDPQVGEAEALAAKRTALMHGEKIAAAVADARGHLEGEQDANAAIRAAMRSLQNVAEKIGGAQMDQLHGAIAALDRASIELAEATDEIDRVTAELDADPGELDRAEERLFALRAESRKHDVAVDDLPALLADFEARLVGLDDHEGRLKELRDAEAAAAGAYEAAAERLTKARVKAAKRIDAAVMTELPSLNLADARFSTAITKLDPPAWGPAGWDGVSFEVAANPGTSPGQLHRVASGGELARIMLALKVVLAEADPVPTIIFDEVDAGIGGATAAAVGDRLAKLAESIQVLVVTHSPQVAARGANHWRVSKSTVNGSVTTAVEALTGASRREEIARMLAGKKISEEARAAADRLLDGAHTAEAHA